MVALGCTEKKSYRRGKQYIWDKEQKWLLNILKFFSTCAHCICVDM